MATKKDTNTKLSPNQSDVIVLEWIKTNNLKNIDLVLPKNQIITFTWVSGSGKSSLAFETIYKEGQFRYIESLSSYLRQFFNLWERVSDGPWSFLCDSNSTGLLWAPLYKGNRWRWNSCSISLPSQLNISQLNRVGGFHWQTAPLQWGITQKVTNFNQRYRCYTDTFFISDKLAISYKIPNLTDWILTQTFLIIFSSYGYKKKHKYYTFTKSIWCNSSRMNQNQQSEKYRLSSAKKSNYYIHVSFGFWKIFSSFWNHI